MAIDTRDKRSSVIGYALPISVFPDPDGTLAEDGDRVHIATFYRGITPAGPEVDTSFDGALMLLRRRRMMAR